MVPESSSDFLEATHGEAVGSHPQEEAASDPGPAPGPPEAAASDPQEEAASDPQEEAASDPPQEAASVLPTTGLTQTTIPIEQQEPDMTDPLTTTYYAPGADNAARNTPEQEPEGGTEYRDIGDALQKAPILTEGDIALANAQKNLVASCNECISFMGWMAKTDDQTLQSKICDGTTSQLGNDVMCDMYREQDPRASMNAGIKSGICHKELCIRFNQCQYTKCEGCQANANEKTYTTALQTCKASGECQAGDSELKKCTNVESGHNSKMSTLQAAPAVGAQIKYSYTSKHNVRTEQIELQNGVEKKQGSNEEGVTNIKDMTVQKINPTDAKTGISYYKLLVHSASVSSCHAPHQKQSS